MLWGPTKGLARRVETPRVKPGTPVRKGVARLCQATGSIDLRGSPLSRPGPRMGRLDKRLRGLSTGHSRNTHGSDFGTVDYPVRQRGRSVSGPSGMALADSASAHHRRSCEYVDATRRLRPYEQSHNCTVASQDALGNTVALQWLDRSLLGCHCVVPGVAGAVHILSVAGGRSHHCRARERNA